MRSLAAALVVVLAVVGCADDDDGPGAAGVTTTTTTTTASPGPTDGCDDADPGAPLAADGSPAEIVAVHDDVSFAIVDRGASVDVISMFRTVDCTLETVRLDGRPATFAVGGSVTHGDGIRCDGDEIVVLSASSDDGSTYQATAVTYELDGADLAEVDRSASTIEAAAGSDELGDYYRLDC